MRPLDAQPALTSKQAIVELLSSSARFWYTSIARRWPLDLSELQFLASALDCISGFSNIGLKSSILESLSKNGDALAGCCVFVGRGLSCVTLPYPFSSSLFRSRSYLLPYYPESTNPTTNQLPANQPTIMASEEERAAILAEYHAAKNSGTAGLYDDDLDDDEEEADFDPSDDDSEEDNDGEDEEEGEKDCAVLTGTIHLNEEGRVIYSGTWCMKSELDAVATAVLANGGKTKETLQDTAVLATSGGGATTSSISSSKKKHPKFKLKSQEVCRPMPASNGNDGGSAFQQFMALFDVRRPTLTKVPASAASTDDNNNNSSGGGDVPARRTMMFDGFFFEGAPTAAASTEQPSPSKDASEKTHHHHGKKVKEKDVELSFSIDASTEKKAAAASTTTVAYQVAGRGSNDYGQFILEGTYTPPTESSSDNAVAKVVTHKTYGVGGSSKDTRSKGSKRSRRLAASNSDDDDDDDVDWDAEKADYSELIELSEDAGLSVEELRKKYYGGGGGGDDGVKQEEGKEEEEEDHDGGGKLPAVKKLRVDDSDDECGF